MEKKELKSLKTQNKELKQEIDNKELFNVKKELETRDKELKDIKENNTLLKEHNNILRKEVEGLINKPETKSKVQKEKSQILKVLQLIFLFIISICFIVIAARMLPIYKTYDASADAIKMSKEITKCNKEYSYSYSRDDCIERVIKKYE